MASTSQISEETLFFPFNPSPPEGEECLEAVYAAFAEYSFVGNWCQQCFPPDIEQAARAEKLREADPYAFDVIYFEHPYCSGGPETFLYFLPRGLEVIFFDWRLYLGFPDRMLRVGVLTWSEHQIAVLRDLFCRVAVSWFEEGHVKPLDGPTHDETGRVLESEVPEYIIQAMLITRVDPVSLAKWLVKHDNPSVWYGIARVLKNRKITATPSYFVLPRKTTDSDYIMACEALNRLVLDGFQQVIDSDRLLEKWMAVQQDDPALANEIAEAELYLNASDDRLDEKQREEARFAVRRVLSG